jgi:hypothetical protein
MPLPSAKTEEGVKKFRTPEECKVCAVPCFYNYYGVRCCEGEFEKVLIKIHVVVVEPRLQAVLPPSHPKPAGLPVPEAAAGPLQHRKRFHLSNLKIAHQNPFYTIIVL